METKKSPAKNYSPEVRGQAIKTVLEHEANYENRWAAIHSAVKIGYHPKTLRLWVQQFERDQGLRSGPSSDEQARIAEVEMATLEWVDCFNHRRLFGPIGNIPPAEAEMNYYQQQTEYAKVA